MFVLCNILMEYQTHYFFLGGGYVLHDTEHHFGIYIDPESTKNYQLIYKSDQEINLQHLVRLRQGDEV